MARKTTSPVKAKTKRTVVKAKPVIEVPAPKPLAAKRKTVFRAGTLIVVLLLVAVIELAIYLNGNKDKAGLENSTPVSEKAYIFTEKDGIVSSIEVKPADGEAVKVARNAQKAWAIVLPSEVEADQGLAEAAASQVSALPIINKVDAGKSPEIFGLDKPAFTITIEFEGGVKHALYVGDTTPSQSGYYARVDKGDIVVTDLSGIEALLQLNSFPPYLNTPTALPPTEAPVVPTEATPTPTP